MVRSQQTERAKPSDAASLRELAERLARPCSVLSINKAESAHRLCEVMKAQLEAEVAHFVAEAGQLPILCSYSSDATPLRCKVRFSQGAGTGQLLVREGRALEEFLLQRSVYKIRDCHGDVAVRLLVHDPVPLRLGKKGWNLAAAAFSFAPTLCGRQPRGIALEHCVFHRGAFGSLARRLQQRHAAEEEDQRRRGGQHASWAGLLTWELSTPCCNHDAQNSLRWGLGPYLDTPESLGDLHVALESLRNSFDMLHSHLAPFLRSSTFCGFAASPSPGG